MGAPEELTTAEWRIVSHGEEAERIDQGRAATDLSALASATSLFLRVIADGQPPESLPTLAEQAEDFVRMLTSIATGLGKTSKELSYQQLVPVRTWNTAISADEELAALTNVLPPLIEHAFSRTGDSEEQVRIADLLDRAADQLAGQAEPLLTS